MLIALGCPKHRVERDRELLRELQAADVAWKDRGTIGFDKASEPLMAAWGRDPHNTGVSWRLARLKVAEGIVEDDPNLARTSFADARSIAVACLDEDLVFAQQRASLGWTVSLENVSIARGRCAAWGALAWTRWMVVTGGAGTALDADAVGSLVTATTASADDDARSLGTWAQGILAAVQPPWSGGNPSDARAALEKAIEMDPEALVRLADLYELVLVPTADPDAPAVRDRILQHAATTPEDQAVQKRIAGTDAAG